jgi:hypothetical protein
MTNADPNADLWGGGPPSGKIDRDFVELLIKATEAGARLLEVVPDKEAAKKLGKDVLWLHDRVTSMIRREVARRIERAQRGPLTFDQDGPAPRFNTGDISVDDETEDL